MVNPAGAADAATIGAAVGMAAVGALLALGTLATFLRRDGACLPLRGGKP